MEFATSGPVLSRQGGGVSGRRSQGSLHRSRGFDAAYSNNHLLNLAVLVLVGVCIKGARYNRVGSRHDR